MTMALARIHGVVPPMLALDWRRAAHRVHWPMIAMPKLNGVRCLATRGRAGVSLRSRSGEPLRLPHVAESLALLMAEGEQWDGELWTAGRSFDQIVAGLRARAEWLRFNAFDSLSERPYADRLAGLRVGGAVDVVEQWPCAGPDAVEALHARAVGAGFEGLVLRDPAAPYRPNGRGPEFVKVKRFDDGEFRADGYTLPGDGSVVFHCRTVEGRWFKARLARVERATVSVDDGCLVTVRHLGWTDNGVPWQPVAVGVRPAFDL